MKSGQSIPMGWAALVSAFLLFSGDVHAGAHPSFPVLSSAFDGKRLTKRERPVGFLKNLHHGVFSPILSPLTGTTVGVHVGRKLGGRKENGPLLQGPFPVKQIALGSAGALIGFLTGTVMIPWQFLKHLTLAFYDLITA